MRLPNERRSRKRNAKKNRSNHARTSSMRQRPITGADFDTLHKGRWNWSKSDR